MPYRVSFFYSQRTRRQSGWSESYFHGADQDADVEAAVVRLQSTLKALHGRQTIPTLIRTSEIGTSRVSDLFVTGSTENTGAPSTATSDYPTTALHLRLRGTVTTPGARPYTVNQWIKGIPDAQVDNGGFYAPAGDYPTRVAAHIAELSSGGWRLFCQDKSASTKKINAISQTGLVTSTAHGFATGSYIRVSRVKGFKPANAIWRISTVSADTYQLLFWVAPLVETPMFGDPRGTLQVKVLPAITSVGSGIVGATERKVGRPFLLSVGRRPARKT